MNPFPKPGADGVIVMLAAIACLATGAIRQIPVVTLQSAGADTPEYEPLAEYLLVQDATFSGTLRKDGRLVTAYDRSLPVGKQTCPT